MSSNGVTTTELRKASQRVIDEINELVPIFRNLLEEMKDYEIKKNVAKTAGTSIGVVGAGIGVGLAFFTGGLSLVWTAASIGTSLAGTAVNVITDVVDREETKEFIRKIKRLLDDYNDAIVYLQSLLTKLNDAMKNLMKEHDMDEAHALHQVLASADFPKTFWGKGLTTGTNLACVLGKSLQAVKLTNTEAGLVLKLFELLTGTTITAAKDVTQASASLGQTATKAVGAVGKTVARGAAVVGVAISVVEVGSTIKDWCNKHPTVEKTEEIIDSLRTTVDMMKSIIDAINKIADIIKQQEREQQKRERQERERQERERQEQEREQQEQERGRKEQEREQQEQQQQSSGGNQVSGFLHQKIIYCCV